MADLALPNLPAATLPVATAMPVAGVTPGIAVDAVATGAVADPFASLIAALTVAAPTPAAPVMVGAAAPTPDAIVLPTIGDALPATDIAPKVADADKASDPTTPVSDVVAMLTFVPPPVIVPVAAPSVAAASPAPVSVIAASGETPAPPVRSGAVALLDSSGPAIASPALPVVARTQVAPLTDAPAPAAEASTPDTPPLPVGASQPAASAAVETPDRATSAAEIVRLLKTGVAPVVAGDTAPDQPAPVVTTATIISPAEAAPDAVAAAVDAPTVTAPAATPRRMPQIAPSRSARAPVAPTDGTTARETPGPERGTEPRHARAEAATPAPFIDVRPDIAARPADTAALAASTPVDDPVARQLDMAKDGQWLDSLARDIAMAGGKDGQLSFRLDPVSLGTLTVQIAQGADGASVRLSASTEQARAILVDAQPRLIAEARAQGLHLRDATVDTTPAPASSGNTNAGSGGQSRGDQGASAQLQQNQQQGGRRTPAQPQADATPRRAPSAIPARDSAELYA